MEKSLETDRKGPCYDYGRSDIMPPDPSETQPLLPTTMKDEPIAQMSNANAAEEGKTAASFLPVIGLLIFGIGAGWVVGHYHGSLLWIIPAVAVISGLTHRRIAHFKKYLLHSIIRTGERERIEGHMESTEWINLILERFWTVFEPELSRQVIEKVNLVLEQQKPGFLDKLILKEFTLGSNPPCVLGARGYQKTLQNIIHLDMDLCFYPAELSEESKQTIIRMRPSLAAEQPVQWNSKIVVVARVGKGIVGVDVPVMIKEMSFFGKLRVQMELMNEMPLLRQIQLSFLETPKIDFILRPLKAIDLMDLPGLSNWMMSMINDNIEAQLVNPNRITINVAGTIEKIKTGVLKVKIISTQGIAFAPTAEPFIKLELNGKARGKTAKAVEGGSIHGRFFILTRALTKPLLFHVMNNANEEVGTASYPLEGLVDKGQLENLSTDVIGGDGKVLGQVLFNLMYVTADDVLDPEADLDSETGIFSVSLKQGQNLLPVGLTDKKIYGEAWIHPKKLEHDSTTPYTDADPNCYRFGAVQAKAKEAAIWEEEPDWEIYIDRTSKTQVTLLIRDAETDQVYGKFSAPVKKLLNRSDWFNIGGDGKINLDFNFRPTADSVGGEELILTEPSVGLVRLKILGASNLEDKKAYYVTAEHKVTEVEIGRTGRSSETSQPVFNKTLTWPVSSIEDVIRLEVYAKDIFKDPMIGALDIPLKAAAEHPNEMAQCVETLVDKKGVALAEEETIRYEIGYFPLAISDARAALESSGSEFPLLPEDFPSDSNCAIFSIEQIAWRNLELGQKNMFVEVQLEDDDEPLAKTAKGTEAFSEGVATWRMYAEKFIREPADEEIILRVKEDRSIGSDDTLATITLPLNGAISGRWYKTKKGPEVMINATLKPIKMIVPTEAENVGVLSVKIISAKDLLAVDSNGFSDPFAVVKLNANKVYKTEVVKKSLDPEWNESFECDVYHRDRDVLNIDFRDWNRVANSRTLGQVNLDLSQLTVGSWQDLDLDLENVSTGRVLLRVKYEPKTLRKKNVIIAAPSAAISGVASGVSSGAKAVFNPVSSLGSKIGHKARGDKDGEDDGRDSPDKKEKETEKEKGKVGSFFSSMGDKVTGRKDKEEHQAKAASPVPQQSSGPKTATVATAAVASSRRLSKEVDPASEDGILSVQFLELKVSGLTKPVDARIKVKQGDKTIFKTEEIKNSIAPNFRSKHIQDTTFILPEVDPAKPIKFALNWSAKSDPAIPEVIFDPDTMDVIEERDDSAIGSLTFPINTAGLKASVIFKFADADDAILKALKVKPKH